MLIFTCPIPCIHKRLATLVVQAIIEVICKLRILLQCKNIMHMKYLGTFNIKQCMQALLKLLNLHITCTLTYIIVRHPDQNKQAI